MAERSNRVEQMKRYLDEHAAEIEAWNFGNVRFDWNPGDIKTHLGRSDRLAVPVRAPNGAMADRCARA